MKQKPDPKREQGTNHQILDSLSISVPEGVYPPSEDSALLANSFSLPAHAHCLDLGCGSGIQGLVMARLGARSVTFCDQSQTALAAARHNAEKNRAECETEFVRSDLFAALSGRRFDLIAFNPPYGPSEDVKWKDTDGGKKGRETLDRFLDQLPEHLTEGGEAFFLQSSLNGEAKTKKRLKELGFAFRIVAREKLFFEELAVYRIQKLNS
jgi:release factor glutamine methyltransferase